MGRLNWSIYIIIGVVVLSASYKIDPQKFLMFIWLGYAFLIVGVAKLGVWFVTKKKETKAEKQEARVEMDAETRKDVSVYCPRCRSVLYGYKNFCSRCGIRLRQRLL